MIKTKLKTELQVIERDELYTSKYYRNDGLWNKLLHELIQEETKKYERINETIVATNYLSVCKKRKPYYHKHLFK